MNRIYALYKVEGAKVALAEAKDLNLQDNHFYFVLLGELTKNINPDKAKPHFQKAWSLAKTQPEKQVIQQKIDRLNNKISA